MALLACGDANDKPREQTVEIPQELVGTWIAGETMMPQPPKEMWQDIKEISFWPNGIVAWSTTQNGKALEMKGRFLIHKDDQSSRGLPSLFVAPADCVNPDVSSVCLLRLSDLEIDLDSRFHPDKVGKVLKAKTEDGKRVVFVRVEGAQPAR